MYKAITLLIGSAFAVLASALASTSSWESLDIISEQLSGNLLILGVGSHVTTQRWGGHGTGAKKFEGYIASYNLDTQALELYGPIFTVGDEQRWIPFLRNKRFVIRQADDDWSAIPCEQSNVIVQSVNGLSLQRPGKGCLVSDDDSWLESAKHSTEVILSPNAKDIFYQLTADGHYLLPRFRSTIHTFDREQREREDNDGTTQANNEFLFTGKRYAKAEKGFYFSRDQDQAQLFDKHCLDINGHDRVRAVSHIGELRLLCERDHELSIRAIDGNVLYHMAIEDYWLKGGMYSTQRKAIYYTRASRVKGKQAIDLSIWDYEKNQISQQRIVYGEAFSKTKLLGGYKVPEIAKPLLPVQLPQ